MNIGKVLLIFFEGNEEKVIDSIISVLGVGREKFAFQQMYSNSEVNYKDIIFDFKRREVVKSNEEKKFTYTEFEILQLLYSGLFGELGLSGTRALCTMEIFTGDLSAAEYKSF